MITIEERAHDVANMIASWELEHIAKRAQEENKTVNVNVHGLYRKYYTELVNIFQQDALFNSNLENE
ncbi:MAG: hypothetical protein ACI4WH_05860 [Oscillospiraceae bacterium]